MPDTPPLYRLVIFDSIDDPQELRELICGATGMHPTDVVQWLARAPGVWPRALEEPVVRKLLDGHVMVGQENREVANRLAGGRDFDDVAQRPVDVRVGAGDLMPARAQPHDFGLFA